MTAKMRAIRLDAVGPPENLALVEIARPELTSDGVLIRNAYAGMIYADAEARRGTYYRETKCPWFPGREAVGVVEAVGRDVRNIEPGDRVAALVLGGGCYAEYVLARTVPQPGSGGWAVPPSDIVRLPDSVSFTQALVYLVNFRLAHLLVHAWARLQSDARIVVHGASGGMGSMILQLAHELGCESIALVRKNAEAAFCRRIGANHAIVVGQADYVEEVLRLTDGAGVTHSFNGVGGDTINRDPRVLAPFGELHCYGYVAGKVPFDLFATDRTLAIKTFNADNFLGTAHFAGATEAMHRWFASGPLLDAGQVFPLARAADAHRAIEAGNVLGKIVLQT
jgi:NADPH2:quinone reductase